MLTKFKIFLVYKNLKILKERSRNQNYITFIGYMPKLYFGGKYKNIFLYFKFKYKKI